MKTSLNLLSTPPKSIALSTAGIIDLYKVMSSLLILIISSLLGPNIFDVNKFDVIIVSDAFIVPDTSKEY